MALDGKHTGKRKAFVELILCSVWSMGNEWHIPLGTNIYQECCPPLGKKRGKCPAVLLAGLLKYCSHRRESLEADAPSFTHSAGLSSRLAKACCDFVNLTRDKGGQQPPIVRALFSSSRTIQISSPEQCLCLNLVFWMLPDSPGEETCQISAKTTRF